MTKTVKLDRINNYLINTATNSIVSKYDRDNHALSLILKLDDGSTLQVDNSMIKNEYGGQVVVQHDDNKYVIDDGFQNVLIKAGYIVYRNYDTEKIYDVKTGTDVRDYIIECIRKVIPDIADSYHAIGSSYDIFSNVNCSELTIDSDSYRYTFIISTVNNIVNKNQRRKENSLPYYPFKKDMDKYGTLYVSVFAQRLTEWLYNTDRYSKYKVADEVISEIISELGIDYHYISIPIRGRVLNYPGL